MASEDMLFKLSKLKQLNVTLNEIESNYVTVTNSEHNLIGIILNNNEKSIKIIDKFKIDNFKINNLEDDGSLCLPDSTLSVNAFESSGSSNNDQICSKCNANIVNNKNNSRKRPEAMKHNDLPDKTDKMTSSSNSKLNNSRKRKLETNDNNNLSNSDSKKVIVETTPSRRLHSRAIKTEANEKIIELATYKPKIAQKQNKSKEINGIEHEEKNINNLETSKEMSKRSKSSDSQTNDENKDQKKRSRKNKLEGAAVTTVKASDVSVYDFKEDDNNQTETVNTTEQISKKKSKAKKEQTKLVKSTTDPADTTSVEHEGEKISINDIVWGKFPSLYLWPGRVKSFKKDNVNDCNKLCLIEWIGCEKKSNLPVHTLFPFEKYFIDSYSSRKRTDKYKYALELTCEELKLDLNELISNAADVNPKIIKKSTQTRVTDTGNVNSRKSSKTNVKSKRPRSKKPVPGNVEENSNKGSTSTDNKTDDRASINRKKAPLNFDDVIFQSPTTNQKINIKSNNLNSNDPVTSFSDEDTDEEEKARGVLITAESLESRNIFHNGDKNKDILQN